MLTKISNNLYVNFGQIYIVEFSSTSEEYVIKITFKDSQTHWIMDSALGSSFLKALDTYLGL